MIKEGLGMSKYSLKDQMRITWNEDKFISTLTDGQKLTFKKLPREKKDDLIYKFINNELDEILKETDPYEEELYKHVEWLSKQGIHDPTRITLEAIYPLVSDSNLSKSSNISGVFLTLDIHKQAQLLNNLILQKQNFALIAQQDKVIKQNDEIIKLLKDISE